VPEATARVFENSEGLVVRRLTKPAISSTISLCVSDHLPLSEAALVVRELLLQKVGELAGSGKWTRLESEPARKGTSLPVLPP